MAVIKKAGVVLVAVQRGQARRVEAPSVADIRAALVGAYGLRAVDGDEVTTYRHLGDQIACGTWGRGAGEGACPASEVPASVAALLGETEGSGKVTPEEAAEIVRAARAAEHEHPSIGPLLDVLEAYGLAGSRMLSAHGALITRLRDGKPGGTYNNQSRRMSERFVALRDAIKAALEEE